MGRTIIEAKSHIVLVPYPGQGHIPPVIHLARKLAENGFIVTMVNIDSIHKVLSKQWTCPPGLDIRLEQVPCQVNMPQGVGAADIKNINSVFFAIEDIEVPTRQLLSQLSPPPCCLVVDYFLSWGTSLAKEMNLHAVTYWPGNAAWSSLHKHLDLLVSRGDALQDETDEARDGVISYIPCLGRLSYVDLPEYMRKKPDKGHEKFFENSKERFDESGWILVNSMSELEPVVFQHMQESHPNFVSIGPMFSLSGDRSPAGVSLRDEDYDCLKWLDTQAENSVLYISFGSIGTLSERAFEELAAGLEASKQPFLWVVRIDLVEVKQEKYSEFLERTHEQGMVVSWAPQLQVLSHSSVGGFLSHCGWNSIFESICHGVPVLGWPIFADQFLNCKLLAEDWKLGKRFSREKEVSREDVEKRITEFMQGEDTEKIRARGREVKELAGKTVREGGPSYTNFPKFVNAMICKTYECDKINTP